LLLVLPVAEAHDLDEAPPAVAAEAGPGLLGHLEDAPEPAEALPEAEHQACVSRPLSLRYDRGAGLKEREGSSRPRCIEDDIADAHRHFSATSRATRTRADRC